MLLVLGIELTSVNTNIPFSTFRPIGRTSMSELSCLVALHHHSRCTEVENVVASELIRPVALTLAGFSGFAAVSILQIQPST